MAYAVSVRAPQVIRAMSRPKTKFICADCGREIEGWAYSVGLDPFNQHEICSLCWAAPRVPPMKPVGDRVVL
jgi:hypothetical protein